MCARFCGCLDSLGRCDVCSALLRRFSLSNKVIPMAAAHRPWRSALDEFLPELDVRHDNGHGHVDLRDIQLDPVVAPPPVVAVEFPTRLEEPRRVTVARDQSRVQWWPMFAAALVGVGVSLLAFGALARFVHF